MKRIVAAIVFAIVSASVFAEGPAVVHADGAVDRSWPSRIEWPDGSLTIDPSTEACIAAGVARWETAEEQAAREAKDAEQIAENQAASAQYADPEPAVFLPRFSGPLTNIVGLSQVLVDADTGEIVAVDETGSPEHTLAQKQERRNAQKAARASVVEAIQTASGNGKVNERFDAIEAALRLILKTQEEEP